MLRINNENNIKKYTILKHLSTDKTSFSTILICLIDVGELLKYIHDHHGLQYAKKNYLINSNFETEKIL